MTEKRVFLASEGPFIYDDEDDLDEYEGVFAGRKQAALTTDGSILVADGADIVLEGDDPSTGNPSILKFIQGTDRTTSINLSGHTSINVLHIYPDTVNEGSVYLGNPNFLNELIVSLGNSGMFQVSAFKTNPSYYTRIIMESPSADVTNTYRFSESAFLIDSNKVLDCANASYAWDDVYADDFQNVADFLFLDDRDDLAVLDQIKGSGRIDPRTGIEMIDDDTLPAWMKTKDKKTGEILQDPEGKPYLSLKIITSLLMGACRQLNGKVTTLEKRIEALESKLGAAVKNLQQGANNA